MGNNNNKTLFWLNMVKIITKPSLTNGGHGRPVSNWCNPYTAPPVVTNKAGEANT
jgi:hypothetical protein